MSDDRIFEVADQLLKTAPGMLAEGETFSYTYTGSPPTLVVVATGNAARKLHGIAAAFYEFGNGAA